MKFIQRILTLLLAVCVCVVFVCVNHLQLEEKQYNGFGETRGDIISRSREIEIEVDASVPQFQSHSLQNPWNLRFQEIVLAVVACGDRLAESLVMIKSAILFTKSPLKFIVFTDDHFSFRETLNEWKHLVNNSFSYELHHITYPVKGDTSEWRSLYRPCASQRLFLPKLLSHIDAVLYMDSDTLFLGPSEDVWRQFELMNSSQIVALSPDFEDANMGHYNRFGKIPYYGKLRVNSGVMLMNLTRMRTFRWTDYVEPIYERYKRKDQIADQDIINIIFHYHPDKLYLSPCRYNYHTIHCASWCHSADKEGAAVLHGTAGAFHNEKQLLFHAIYTVMKVYQLGTDPHRNLYLPIMKFLKIAPSSLNCGKVKHIFSKSLERYFQKIRKITDDDYLGETY